MACPAELRLLHLRFEERRIRSPLSSTAHLQGITSAIATFQDDIDVVRKELESLVHQGRDVILVMHSYGGAVGTEACSGMSSAQRYSHGLQGGIVHLLYMCAYMLKAGGCMNDIVEKAGFMSLLGQYIDFDEDGTCWPKDPGVMMFDDLDSTQKEEQMTLLRRFCTSTFSARTTYAAWKDIPSSYIFTSKDFGVPPIYQEIMTNDVKAEGIVFREEHYDATHDVFLTRTKDMVEAVWRVFDTIET